MIQKGDLGIQLKYITRLRIFLVLSVARMRRTLRLYRFYSFVDIALLRGVKAK